MRQSIIRFLLRLLGEPLPEQRVVESSQAPSTASQPEPTAERGRSAAYNRLRLVLMHDRTQLEPQVLEQMRDEMVHIISKYVKIDQQAIELNLEMDKSSNQVSLVANVPVLRNAEGEPSTEATEQSTTNSPSASVKSEQQQAPEPAAVR